MIEKGDMASEGRATDMSHTGAPAQGTCSEMTVLKETTEGQGAGLRIRERGDNRDGAQNWAVDSSHHTELWKMGKWSAFLHKKGCQFRQSPSLLAHHSQVLAKHV